MPTQQPGRTAPWAKAFGAVLLALVTAIVATYAISHAQDADRELAAFEATRKTAQRFADSVASRNNTPPIARQDVQQALDSAVGKGHGLLFGVASTNGRTRVVARFSHMYHRSFRLFGPADVIVRRCFTIDFEAGERSARINAHSIDDSCTEIARQVR